MIAASRFQPNDDLVHRRVAGESILVPIRGSVADMQRLYALDEVGAFAWGMLDGVKTVADIGAAITEAFEVDAETARADLEKFLAQLLDQGLIAKATSGAV